MRTMYDSTDPNAIPTNAQMVAGYIDGIDFRWPESAWSRFPSSVKVRIARRTGTNDGHVLDVEKGIPTVWPLTDPAVQKGIVDWVQRRRMAGVAPTIYCNELNDWQPLRQIFINARVIEPQWWVARYNNAKTIPPGAIAKQYANPPVHNQGHFDLSVVADYWPGVDAEVADMTPDQAAQLTRIENTLLLTAQAPVVPEGTEGTGSHETVHDAIWHNRRLVQDLLASEPLGDAIKEAVAEYFAEHPPTVTVDYAAIAKAVNDDAARRQAE